MRSNVKFNKHCIGKNVQNKIMIYTTDKNFFAALTQGWFSALSSVFLMKPGVHCQAKRQNKFENIHLSVFTGRTQNKERKKMIKITKSGTLFDYSIQMVL